MRLFFPDSQRPIMLTYNRTLEAPQHDGKPQKIWYNQRCANLCGQNCPWYNTKTAWAYPAGFCQGMVLNRFHCLVLNRVSEDFFFGVRIYIRTLKDGGKRSNNEEKKYEKGHGDRMCLLCGFPKTRLSTETFSASQMSMGKVLSAKHRACMAKSTEPTSDKQVAMSQFVPTY